MATVHQINSSRGGVPKTPIGEAVIDVNGVVGDIQADTEHHGSLDQALCLYSLEVIEALQAEGHPITPGSTGENLTIAGLDWDRVVPGVKVQVGQVLLETTDPATPCSTIAGSFSDRRSARIHAGAHPGWGRMYAKVISGGEIRDGDEVVLID